MEEFWSQVGRAGIGSGVWTRFGIVFINNLLIEFSLSGGIRTGGSACSGRTEIGTRLASEESKMSRWILVVGDEFTVKGAAA